MMGTGCVLACMTIFRIIATAYMAAGPTQAQMHPGIAAQQTLHTAATRGRDLFDTVKMCTTTSSFTHRNAPRLCADSLVCASTYSRAGG
jgi:hypothetical protein